MLLWLLLLAMAASKAVLDSQQQHWQQQQQGLVTRAFKFTLLLLLQLHSQTHRAAAHCMRCKRLQAVQEDQGPCWCSNHLQWSNTWH
jgi:hypothetical protein